MPAQITHFLHATESVPKNAENDKYKDAVSLGAIGPDFLYYYKMLSTSGRSVRNIGTALHSVGTDKMFGAFCEYLNRHPNDTAAKYFTYGFACHFALDQTTHPYVYFVQDHIIKAENFRKNPIYKHVLIEHSLDVIMVRDKMGITAGKFGLKNCVPLDSSEIFGSVVGIMTFVINRLFSDDEFTEKQCEKAYRDCRKYLRLATDKTGIKRFLVRIAETICLMRGTVSNFIHPFMEDGVWDYSNYEKADWTDNDGNTRDDSFFELYEKSKTRAAEIIGEIDTAAAGGVFADEYPHHNMKGILENE